MNRGARYFRPDSRDPRKQVETRLNHCLTPRCRALVDKQKSHSPYCSKCASRRFAEKHPLKYSFNNLRHRAKQRGHKFLLTFAQYELFALKSGYAVGKGKSRDSLSIDRIDNDGPYSVDNIKCETVSYNSMKGTRKQFVPFFMRQQENVSFQPTAEDLASVQNQLSE